MLISSISHIIFGYYYYCCIASLLFIFIIIFYLESGSFLINNKNKFVYIIVTYGFESDWNQTALVATLSNDEKRLIIVINEQKADGKSANLICEYSINELGSAFETTWKECQNVTEEKNELLRVYLVNLNYLTLI